ncbi:MAG: hypothetical protein FWB83_09650 [Treponema sp.]|nr:hypothetical protein [Treponema sp.]
MTKIRNTFTAGCKFGGYAGPADSRRGGSREKLSGFSGVSPPCLTSRIINVIKKSLSVPLAAAVIAGKIFFTGALAAGSIGLMTSCSESAGDTLELTGTVSISGSIYVGQELTANTNSLAGDGGITYQWKRGNTIIGDNSNTYTLQTSDAGSTITVTVSRTGYTGSVMSDPTDIILLPLLTGKVVINGVFETGQILTADTDELGGSGDISFQWKRNETIDIGTDSGTYILQNDDVGFMITVIVTRSGNSGNVSANRFLFYTRDAIANPVLDVDVPRYNTGWNGERIRTETRSAVTQLDSQSQDLSDLYANWETELRANNGTAAQINFAQQIQGIQEGLQTAYQRDNVVGLQNSAATPISNLLNQIGGLLSNQNERDLFTLQIEAYRMAIQLDQRERYNGNDKITAMTNFNHKCNQLEVEHTTLLQQAGTYGERAQILRGWLTAMLPAAAGPYRNGLLQQFEDYSQFGGYADDLRAAGVSTVIPAATANIQATNNMGL